MYSVLSLLFLIFLTPDAPAPDAPATDAPVAERIRVAARAELAARFPEEAHRLQVRVIRLGGVDAGDERLKVTFQERDALPRGHANVNVWKTMGGGWSKAGWALLYVSHFDSVVVARESVPKDAPVVPTQLTFAWMDVTAFRGRPLPAHEYRELARGEVFATRPLQEGRPLRSGDLRPPYAATTGDVVNMRYRRGVITLQVSCKAREPGFAGEIIRLYNPETDTMYRARLLEAGKAEWVSTMQ